MTIAFSVLFGLWIDRIIDQSKERRELIGQLQATREELGAAHREAGVMAERERMAAEIHDTLAQGFTSILMLLQAAEPRIGTDPAEARRQVGLAARTARENLAEARALVAAVPPAALGDASLDEAIRRLGDRLGEELDLDAECVVSGEPRRLDARSEVVLLRAAQEGLANVRKHAKASRVRVELAYGAAAVCLEIRDDGAGFDPDARERLRPARHARPCRPGRGDAAGDQRARRGHLAPGGGAGGMIRILLVDDHPVVREGLRGMLAAEDDLAVVAEAGGAAEAVAATRAHAPDVVLMDLRMPGGDGVEATARVLAQRPEARVVVLTTYETDADILRAVEAGAAGYLLKDASRAELAQAIRAAARGETVLAPSVAAKLVSRMRSPVELSRREIEVLRLVARGRTNAEIGRELLISEATVKTHLLRTFGKLEVSDRTAAVTVALERGILPAPGR